MGMEEIKIERDVRPAKHKDKIQKEKQGDNKKLWVVEGGYVENGRRLLATWETLGRFAWELRYHDGTVRRQYERLGSSDQLLTTDIAFIRRHGVKAIIVHYLIPENPRMVARVPVPPLTEVEFSYSVHWEPILEPEYHGPGRRRIIYSFGYSFPDGGGRSVYLHIEDLGKYSNPPYRGWVNNRLSGFYGESKVLEVGKATPLNMLKR